MTRTMADDDKNPTFLPGESQCDACGEMMPPECLTTGFYLGIETTACARCRSVALSDTEIVRTIQKMLDGVEWDNSMLEEIAELLRENCYQVREPSEDEPEAVCKHCGSRNTMRFERSTHECYDCGETYDH